MTQEITQHADPQRRDLEERRAVVWSKAKAKDAAREARSEARSALRARARAQLRALGDAAAVRSTMDVAATADPEPHQTLRYPAGRHPR